MIVSRFFRDMWCRATLENAVRLFRGRVEGGSYDLTELERIARHAADAAFQESAHMVSEDRARVAEQFREMYVQRFTAEIGRILSEAEGGAVS